MQIFFGFHVYGASLPAIWYSAFLHSVELAIRFHGLGYELVGSHEYGCLQLELNGLCILLGRSMFL